MCLLNAARFQMFNDKKKLHLTCVELITTHLCVFLYVHFFLSFPFGESKLMGDII